MDHLSAQVDPAHQASHLHGWSVRRRWTVLALLPALLLLCCGGLAAVPVLHLRAEAGAAPRRRTPPQTTT